MIAPAPAAPPATLESVFAEARLLAFRARAAAPDAVLSDARSTAAQRLAAIEALHRSLPSSGQSKRTRALESMRLAAVSATQPPEVRAAALLHLGYSIPLVDDEPARILAVRALLAAAASPLAPADRLSALRGLSAASHNLPPVVEAEFQTGLLDLLPKGLSEAESVAALLSIDGLIRSDKELARRRPDLILELETRLLAPLEADPAAFAASGTPATRALVIAAVWHAARRRHSAGDAAPLARVDAALRAALAAETDAAVQAEINSFLAAPPPDPLLKSDSFVDVA